MTFFWLYSQCKKMDGKEEKMRFLVVLVTLLTFSQVQADVTVRIGLDGVVMAGKQRGNLFHMLGYYTQLLTKQNYHYPRENLDKDIREYESILSQCKEIFSDDEVQSTLGHSQKIWRTVKPELLSVIKKSSSKTLEASTIRTLMENIILLSNDMQKIQEVLTKQDLDKEVIEGSRAASDIIESSAQLSAYYLINTSPLGTLVDAATVTESSQMYQHAFEKLSKSDFNQGKIFQKRFKGLKKVYYFNTMTAEFSKTAVPALMIKKNNKAYLDAFVSLKLITAASTEGIQKTVQMFLK